MINLQYLTVISTLFLTCLSQTSTRYVHVNNATIQVTVQGNHKNQALVILPSYGRGSGKDFDEFAQTVAEAGYHVLRPQPRGVMGSIGNMQNQTLSDASNDIVTVIAELSCDHTAIVLGHAYGNLIARKASYLFPETIPAIIVASAAIGIASPEVENSPYVAGNLSLPREQRLDVLQRYFFAPNHDASIWLDGWYPDTLAMQKAGIEAENISALAWGRETTPILQIIAAEDPFEVKGNWSDLRNNLGSRVQNVVVEDASHALFPEQPQEVARHVLSWLQIYSRE